MRTYNFIIHWSCRGSKNFIDVDQKTRLDLPTSCGVRVFTTCAAQSLKETAGQDEGDHSELQRKGYAFCVLPNPHFNLTIETK